MQSKQHYRPKVLLSFGIGRLHFVQAAQALNKSGVHIEVSQGYVPKKYVLTVFKRVFARSAFARRVLFGLEKRRLAFISNKKNHSHPLPEFLQLLLLQLSRYRLISQETAYRISWQEFGRRTANHVVNQDILHVRAGAGYETIKAANIYDVPTVVDFSIAHPDFMKSTLEPEYRMLKKQFSLNTEEGLWRLCIDDANSADAILVNSEFVRSTLVSRGIPEQKIYVSYLGVRSDFFGIKSDYSMEGTLKILFSGTFGIRKGAHYLIPALEKLVTSGIELELTVLGAIEEAKDMISGSPISEKIRVPGFIPQDELRQYLSSADIYVFPSLVEGCASSAMEAMAAGLPVVATRESGLPIVHGRNGYLIPAKSSDAIAEAILALSRDKNLRSKLGKKATNEISSTYTWEAYAENVQTMYARLIDLPGQLKRKR